MMEQTAYLMALGKKKEEETGVPQSSLKACFQ
jgi:hypothetical protein